MEVQNSAGAKTKKRPRGAPFQPGQVANPRGREPGTPNKVTRVLKDAILLAAEKVGQDGKGKNGLEGFLIAQAKKADNRGFMALLGRVLPLQIGFDKNRPLTVVSRVELVRPEGPDAPRDVTPPRPRPALTIEAERSVPPAPPAPVKVRAPSRSGT